MKYLCVHCDKRFEHETEGKGKVRCPECMRVHGIEKIGDAAAEAQRPKWLLPAVVAGVAAAIVAGYVIWARETPDTVSGDVPLRPLEHSELLGYVRASGARAEDALARMLESDEAVEDFAEEATAGAGTKVEKAEKMVEAIRARQSAQAFVRWQTSSPRDTPVRGPKQTLETLQEDGGRARLYSLEVAALAVAALRSVGVDAMVAEIYAFPGDRSPPDPSGHLGYFGVAVWDGEPGEGAPKIFDPYGGRGSAPEEDDTRVLNDAQVVAAALNHRAIHQLVHEGDSERAFELAQNALKLDRRSPSIRSVRGAVLVTSGGNQEGAQEFEAAAQIRPDAPRHNNLAGLALAQQDLERAAREVAAALEQHPDFAGGHATLAAVHLARSEVEESGAELRRAEELDPSLPMLPMLWANYYLATRDVDSAVEKAMEAIERRPHDWTVRLNAARVLRVAGRYDDMRREARQILADAPPGQEPAVRQLIEQVLGPTALEEPLGEEEELETAEGALPNPDFDLASDSMLLGGEGGGSGGTAPSLLGDEEPLLNMGDPSKLRLRDPGSDLQLDLSE